MGDILSQAEIEALLGGGEDSANAGAGAESETVSLDNALTGEEKDILGEVGNISMGTAATTLFALLNQKVWITTPNVMVMRWGELSGFYDRPCVGVRVDYKEGLEGSNIMILNEKDVRVISSLMMGGDGKVEDEGAVTELDLSAIGEAMNQMVGSSSTSMSSMIGRKIDIDTPQAFVLDFSDDSFFNSVGYSPDDLIACVLFKMEIGALVNSQLMQIYPIDFAKGVIDLMMAPIKASAKEQAQPVRSAPPKPETTPQPEVRPAAPMRPDYASGAETRQFQSQNVNARPAQFQDFDVGAVMRQKENIEIIMDVPLEVSVELGRTHKKIKDILEFSPGSVIELDKLAGEPIDILVNGKFVANGEVVVIDENFGIRITDIISADKRV